MRKVDLWQWKSCCFGACCGQGLLPDELVACTGDSRTYVAGHIGSTAAATAIHCGSLCDNALSKEDTSYGTSWSKCH
eukprot:12917894-Prorocentrum_lima.AAC.1